MPHTEFTYLTFRYHDFCYTLCLICLLYVAMFFWVERTAARRAHLARCLLFVFAPQTDDHT
jgi:hypothetical protein